MSTILAEEVERHIARLHHLLGELRPGDESSHGGAMVRLLLRELASTVEELQVVTQTLRERDERCGLLGTP